jgi:LacI family transcriptional regulator, fructose operon transcriptional repressor
MRPNAASALLRRPTYMPSRKATIYDLAELAQVSASTVSAVLSGNWKARRIAEATALKVQRLATAHEFNVNRQASGLRKSRSGLIGMIIPLHDNRFFSEMAQVFERLARERHWYPLVVSTLRDPALELETVNTLISYRIEHLIVTGATDPDPISRACRTHGVAHVNVDLPGTAASSVISDNYWGAAQLTHALLDRSRPMRSARRTKAYFVGGVAQDYATRRRIEGFTDALEARGANPGQVEACGYAGELAEAAVRRLYAGLRGLPRALFVNSTIALEGVVRFLNELPQDELAACAFGCYDWDPFAAALRFPLLMVRQDVPALLGEAFRLIDAKSSAPRRIIEIKPRLMFG